MPHWPQHGRIDRPDRDDRLRVDRQGDAAADRASLRIRPGALRRHRSGRFRPQAPRRARRPLRPSGLTRDNYRDVLTQIPDRGLRPGLLRQPLGRHLLARPHAPLPRARRALHRHRRRALAGLLLRQVARQRGAHQLRAARDGAGRTAQESGRLDRHLVLRRQSGMVSWFVKQALVNLAKDLGDKAPSRRPRTSGHVSLSASASRACISPSATRSAPRARSRATCSSTPGRSKASCRKACSRPNSAGARMRNGRRPTRATTRPAAARRSTSTSPAPIRACAHGRRPRAAQFGFLVTHNEAISIADYYTVRNEKGEAVYRPTCHYAYHPCDDAVLSLHELFGRAGEIQSAHHILGEAEILDGVDELGVLLYGHARNAYWYGSQLSVEETRALAPYQNATGMQVTSAVLAGMVWALENPNGGNRGGRRTGLPPLPRGSDALSRPGRRRLYRLDAARRSPGPLP